ncbi:MAG: hypothetical protein ACOYXB_09725 [Bacteroidota bacterium]
MKQLKIVALVGVLALLSSDALGAGWFQEWRSSRQQRQVQRYQHKHHHGQRPPSGTPVGAPIDGGLLAILGAAGVAYYGVKKNKKNSTEE